MRSSSPAIQTMLQTVRQRWGENALFVAGEATGSGRNRFSPLLPTHEMEHTEIAPLRAYLRPGQIVEISGAPGSGKSALALALLQWLLCREPCWDPCRAGSQYGSREGSRQGLAAYVDSPRTFYPPGAAATGVDLSRLWVVRLPEWPAELAATELLLASGAVDVVLWDLVGRRKTWTSGQLQRLRSAAAAHGATLILLTTQSPRRTYRPLDYDASVRLLVHRQEFLWEQIGSQRLLAGYRIQVDIARAPGKPHLRPITLTLGERQGLTPVASSPLPTPRLPARNRQPATVATPHPPACNTQPATAATPRLPPPVLTTQHATYPVSNS